MFRRIRKSLKAKKQKNSEPKDNSSGNNDNPQQKQVETTPEEIIEQLRIEILNEQSKISNLQKSLRTASHNEAGIREANYLLYAFSDSVSDMVDMLMSNTNLNNNMAAVFEFASQLPQIGVILIPISAIITIVKKHEDVKTAMNGLWKRLLTLLNQITELVSWVKKKQIVGEGFDETLRMYLDLINECTVTMKTICADREKKNLVQKVWYGNTYIDEITSLENKIDSNLKRRTESNGIKTLLITENNASGIAQILDIVERIDRNTNQSQLNNLNTIVNVLDSFSKEDENLIFDNTTTEKFMDGTREWIFNKFISWVYSTDKKKRVLILTAPAGFGKSQIVYQLVKKNRHDNVIAWHFVRYDSTRRSNPKRMLLSIAYQLSLHLSDYKSELEDIIRNLTKSELLGPDYNLQDIFETLLQTPLNNMTSTKPFVIIIDALDECNNNHKNDLLKCIQKYFCKLPLWLKVFITTRPEYPLIHELRSFDPMEINPSTDVDNKEDLRKFFQNVLTNENYTLSNNLNVDRVTTELITKSDGLFMVARFLVDMLQSNMNDLTLDYIARLPNGMEEFYKQHFQERIFHNDDWSERIPWKVLQLIVVAKQPMTLLLIRNIIKCELKDLRKAIENLSLFLTLSSPDSKAITISTQVSVFHKSLVDWLTDTNREMEDFYVNIQIPNGLIGKYCIEFFDKEQIACIGTSTKYKRCTTLPTNFDLTEGDYIFNYGIQHLVETDMLKEARQILLNVGWIVMALQIKNPYDMVRDYELLEYNDLVIHLIGRSIKLSLSIIQKKGWKQIPCQLVGRLYSSTIKRSSHDQIYIQLMSFINRLKTFSYGFSWWCPIGPTWEQAETACLKVFKGHDYIISFVSFNPDATLVVSCNNNHNYIDKIDRTMLIWNAKNDEIVHEVEIEGRLLTGSWSDFGLKIVTYCYISMELTVWYVTMEDQPIKLKTLYLGIELNTTDNQFLWDLKVVISPNQNLVAIVGDKFDNILIWNIASDENEFIIHQQQIKWTDITWSPDGTKVATYSKYFNKVSFWELNITESKLNFQYDVPISDDGGRISLNDNIDWCPTVPRVAVKHGNTIFIIDTSTDNGQIICQFPTSKCHHFVWSPVGTAIAVASRESLVIWNINNSNCTCEWKQDMRGSIIDSLAWSKDGMKLISGDSDNSVCIWSTIITTSTTKEYNQLPEYAIVEQEEENNNNMDRNDVVLANDSLDLFSPNKVDWKDLISDQRLQFMLERKKNMVEYIWLQNDHTMVVAQLFDFYDKNDKSINMFCEFYDSRTGKSLGYKVSNTMNDVLDEITRSDGKCDGKCAILETQNHSVSFSYHEQTDSEITKDTIDIISPDIQKDSWSVHGKFAIGMKNNLTKINFFTLIISKSKQIKMKKKHFL